MLYLQQDEEKIWKKSLWLLPRYSYNAKEVKQFTEADDL